MATEAQFGLPPEKALAFFRDKGLATSFAWQDQWQAEHDSAFTVAKMMNVDLLRDVRAAVDKAITEGATFEMFRDSVEGRLVEAGWWGKAEMADPATGEKKLVQLGSPRRLRTIYRTNVMTAYAAGQWAEIQEAKASAPYLMYDAVDDDATREEHAAWDGTVLPADDPWWDTHYPPNGWNCRCGVIQLSAADVESMGLQVADKAPASREREYVNPRTGEVSMVPSGIDPGWAYAPGASRQQLATDDLARKAAAAEPEVGAQVFSQLSLAESAAFQATHEEWVERAFAPGPRMTPAPTRIVGGVGIEDLAQLKAAGIEPQTAAITLDGRLLNGPKATRHRDEGNALSEAEWKQLPRRLARPDDLLTDEKGAFYFVWSAGDRVSKIVVQIDRVESVKGERLAQNSIRSAFKVTQRALESQRLRSLRGKK